MMTESAVYSMWSGEAAIYVCGYLDDGQERDGQMAGEEEEKDNMPEDR